MFLVYLENNSADNLLPFVYCHLIPFCNIIKKKYLVFLQTSPFCLLLSSSFSPHLKTCIISIFPGLTNGDELVILFPMLCALTFIQMLPFLHQDIPKIISANLIIFKYEYNFNSRDLPSICPSWLLWTLDDILFSEMIGDGQNMGYNCPICWKKVMQILTSISESWGILGVMFHSKNGLTVKMSGFSTLLESLFSFLLCVQSVEWDFKTSH